MFVVTFRIRTTDRVSYTIAKRRTGNVAKGNGKFNINKNIPYLMEIY